MSTPVRTIFYTHTPAFTHDPTDVGGGSVHNNTTHALARIPLRWIIRECFRCDTGIMFDAAMLQQIGLGLSVSPAGAVSLPLDPPPRIRGDAPPLPGDDTPAPPAEPGVWARFWRTIKGWAAWPFVPLVGLVGLLLGRRAVGGWISDSARGRRVVAGRMRADRAHALMHGDARGEAHPHAVDVRLSVEVDPEYEAREERRALNGQLDQVQESLDQAEALLGRTGSLREFLLPFTPLTRGPVQVERRPGIDCCAGVRTGLFVPWTWSLRQRREDAGEHGGSVIASG